jgi:uncharacterized Fe-S center protein
MKLKLPEELTDKAASPPIYRLKIKMEGADLARPDKALTDRINASMAEVMAELRPRDAGHQALLKVHIGEPRCTTRMRPEYAGGADKFLRSRGADCIVAGDTTVAYTGPRGHRANPEGDCSAYLNLAERQGWHEDGPAGMPFVVLDRPSTTAETDYCFEETGKQAEVEGIERFTDFHPAPGFAAADCIVNYAHLTLHGLAGVAGCVKSIAMGCAGLRGKLRMHQSLLPSFDPELCEACGACVRSCPEDALALPEGAMVPVVDPESCIGCGECEAVCASINEAVSLHGREITDWERGANTLPTRMADYTLGLMNGRWQKTIHVLHMYSITRRCDCINVKQEPMIENDPGFLIGKNPFAMDMLAEQILRDLIRKEGARPPRQNLLTSAEESASYVNDVYGITSDLPVETITIERA